MQPTYLPWAGYFDMIDQSDVFVLLDNVQFEKQSWQQRNRIKTRTGLAWLTVPVRITGRSEQRIAEASISELKFAARHRNLLAENYRHAAHFESVFETLSASLRELSSSGNLADLNHGLISRICETLGIFTPLLRSTDLGVEGKRSELTAEICRQVGSRIYLSAAGSAAYLLGELPEFTSRGLEVVFQNYEHPEYTQQFPPFVPFTSVIDLIFNEGPASLGILRSGRRRNLTTDEMRDLIDDRSAVASGPSTGATLAPSCLPD
jgi:hypothetical protein